MPRILLAAALLTLALPVAAEAATYSVAAGQGPCGGADLQCGSLSDAAAAVMPTDVVEVAPGTYPAATFGVGGITIRGTAAGVIVDGPLVFTGASGGAPKLQRVVIRRTSGAGPALEVSGTAGLELSDALVLAAGGHGALFSAGASNRVERSTLITGEPSSNGILLRSDAGTPAKSLTIDSSIVAGGAAGLAARTFATELQAAPGNITVTARHLTAAGSARGIVLDSSQAARLIDPGVGNIAATVSDSIVLGGTTTATFDGVLGGDNTATLNFTRTRQTGDPSALFVNPAKLNFHLKAGSPAIDQGRVTAGESATDIDGDARPGPVTDQGADEFVNRPPVAKIAASPTRVRQRRPVTFSAAGSTDPDGPLKEYRWVFSDGTTQTTTGSQVTKSFPDPGIEGAVLRVVDVSGGVSEPVAAVVAVFDGDPPAVSITRPRNGSTLRRGRRGGRERLVTFAGRASDPSGVKQVSLTLRQVTRSRRSCRWFNPRRGLVRRSCSRPLRFRVNEFEGQWLYTVPHRRRLRAGSYVLTASGVDNAGISGNSSPGKRVRFRVR